MAATSQHIAQIPQAVSIAASPDPSISSQLRHEAIEYLNKVKELSEETWQACFALYIQGAGATAASPVGKDGKEKLSAELRVYCLQVVDDVLGNKPLDVISEADLNALYEALVGFVQTEYVEGSSEQGMSYLRNKLCYTLTLVFLRLYPFSLPNFLQPFLHFLNAPSTSSSATQMSPTILTLHVLCEIAAEVHDPLLKSARAHSEERRVRDGAVRDHLRSNGDTKRVMEALEGLVERGMDNVGQPVWSEAVEWALRATCSWAPWVDISIAITPSSLSLYQRLVAHSSSMLREAGLAIYLALLRKGMKTGAEKVQVLKVLDVMAFVAPLEEKSRDSEDAASFRTGLARVLSEQGAEALKVMEDNEADQNSRQQAETMYNATLPFLIRFLGEDSADETTQSIMPLLNDTMRLYKKAKKANETTFTLPADKKEFLNTLIEALVRRMQWRQDATWGMGGDVEEDADPEEVEAFMDMRRILRSTLDAIAEIDPELFNNKVGGLVMDIYNAIRSNGPSSVSWQQAELAVYMTYVFGETQKIGMGKEAFFIVPGDVQAMLKERSKAKSDHFRALKKGETNGGMSQDLQAPININFTPFPLTAQGQMLLRAVEAQVFSYPHSAVNLQFFECCARYSEFFKSRKELIQPVLEAFVDSRGIHQPQPAVRQRVFYLFAKFVKDVKSSIDPSFVPAILGSMGDVLPVVAVLPEMESPEDNVLIKATTGSQPFDNQLYLFEAVGTLISLLWRDPSEQLRMMQAVIGPLVRDIDAGLQRPMTGGTEDALQILQIHHLVMSIGSIAKGFPDAPELLPAEAPMWISAFEQAADGIFRALDVMKSQRIVRDAARSAFSGVFAALSTRMSRYIPDLVVRMIGQCEAQEMIEFMGFLSMLIHKLKGDIFAIMDELWLHLLERITLVLSLPVTGTDDAVLQLEMRKAYVAFVSTILSSGVQDFLISDRNKPQFESFINSLLTLATDESDRVTQRTSMSLIARTLIIWATNPAVAALPNAGVYANADAAANSTRQLTKRANGEKGGVNGAVEEQGLPGYERMIYDRIAPTLFQAVMSREMKMRDGQSQLLVHELASFLRELVFARGQEALTILTTQTLPALNCPPEAALGLMERLRNESGKEFRRTFLEFIKEWRTQVYASSS